MKYTDSTGATSTLSASTNGAVSDADGQIVAPIIDNLAAGQTVSGNVVVNVTPLGAPADQIEFDVDGQYRYAKVAEAPHRHLVHLRGVQWSAYLDRQAVGAFGKRSYECECDRHGVEQDCPRHANAVRQGERLRGV